MIEEFITNNALVEENKYYLKYDKNTKEIKSPLEFVTQTFAELLTENSIVVLFDSKKTGLKYISDNSLIDINTDTE